MKIDKQIIKMKYDEDTDMLHILGTVNEKPIHEDEYIYATIDEVIKLKSTAVFLETLDVPQIIRSAFEKQ